MTVRTIIMAVVLTIPAFVFNVSCEKEQPITEESAIEPSVKESLGEAPHDWGPQGDEADTEEDEEMGYKFEEDEGEDEDLGLEPDEEDEDDEDENDELEEDEGEDEDTVYESDADEQA
jgi:hypothetical protein